MILGCVCSAGEEGGGGAFERTVANDNTSCQCYDTHSGIHLFLASENESRRVHPPRATASARFLFVFGSRGMLVVTFCRGRQGMKIDVFRGRDTPSCRVYLFLAFPRAPQHRPSPPLSRLRVRS